jgi:hypothetical protein
MVNKVTEEFGDLSLIDIIYAQPNEDSAFLELITVGYVDGTPEIQTNLLDKLEGYLNHIHSEEFKRDYPQSNVYIIVSFDVVPDELITDLLYKCILWCKENGAILKIRIGKDYVHFVN